MDINSKEFKKKYKNLFDKGYCAECIARMTSSLNLDPLCKKCQKIFDEEIRKYL